MEGIIGDRILRCSDGHVFVAGEAHRLFGSVHLGPRRFIRCPVDKKWRVARNVDSKDLSQEEMATVQQRKS